MSSPRDPQQAPASQAPPAPTPATASTPDAPPAPPGGNETPGANETPDEGLTFRDLSETPTGELLHMGIAPAPPVSPAPAAPAPLPTTGGWALTFGILGLIVSLFVGWGFLIGLVGAALAITTLRHRWESRSLAGWALALSVLSLIYSAGWLWWASTQGPLFG